MKKIIIAIVLLLAITDGFSQEAITVKSQGSGKPILFLPGFTCPGTVWNETIENLDGDYKSYSVSYAGFNGLAPIDTPWYNPIKQQLIEYIKKEHLQNLTIVGHSMGGNLAIDIAAALPNDVKRLVLVESIPCMREVMMPGVPAAALQYNSPYNQQTLAMGDDAFAQMAKNMSQNMTTKAEKIDTLTHWILQADRKTYVYGYTDLLKLDLRASLGDVKAKTLILGASFPDVNSVTATYEKQYAKLGSKKILIADNSKHFIMFDQPDWFYQLINNFLNNDDAK